MALLSERDPVSERPVAVLAFPSLVRDFNVNNYLSDCYVSQPDCPRPVQMHRAAMAVRAMPVVRFNEISVKNVAGNTVDELMCGFFSDIKMWQIQWCFDILVHEVAPFRKFFCCGDKNYTEETTFLLSKIPPNYCESHKKTGLSTSLFVCAQNGTRTHTPLPELGPEPSASTNSAIWALQKMQQGKYRPKGQRCQLHRAKMIHAVTCAQKPFII